MLRRHLPTALLLLLVLALPVAGGAAPEPLFRMSDPGMDDTGPGSYRYPQASPFRDHPGMLDLRDFTVTDEGDLVAFRLEFKGRLPVGGANNFTGLMVDIYIDTDHVFGSGITRALAGRCVRFRPESAWDRMILVCPGRDVDMADALREKTEDLEMVGFKDRCLIPPVFIVTADTITVKVDRKKLGSPNPAWGYQVLVLGFDAVDREPTSFYNIEAKGSDGEFQFGGGDNEYGGPNVIDCLVPKGASQKAILSAYRTHPNPKLAEFAYVPMCYSERGAFLKQARDEMKTPTPVAAGPAKKQDPDDFLMRLKLERDLPPDAEDAVAAQPVPLGKPAAVEVVESRLTPSGQAIPLARKPRAGHAAVATPTVPERLADMLAGDEYETYLTKRAAIATDLARVRPAESAEAKMRKKPAAGQGLNDFDPDLRGYLSDTREGDAAFKKLAGGTKPVVAVPVPVAPKREKSSLAGWINRKKAETAAAKPKPAPAPAPRAGKARGKTREPLKTAAPPPVEPAPAGDSDASAADPARAACATAAKQLIGIAEKYHQMFPADPSISISDLKSSGLLDEPARCPSGGRYVVNLNDGRLEVECINVNGTGHGTIRP